MPVVAPIIAAVAAAGASAAASGALAGAVAAGVISATTSAIISAVVGAVVSLAVGYAASALLGTGAKSSSTTNASSATATDRTQLIRQSVASHRIIVGSVKVSGVVAFLWSPTAARASYVTALKGGTPADFKPNQLLYLALALSSHPAGAIAAVTADPA